MLIGIEIAKKYFRHDKASCIFKNVTIKIFFFAQSSIAQPSLRATRSNPEKSLPIAVNKTWIASLSLRSVRKDGRRVGHRLDGVSLT
jgi:hypothetical protein